MNSRIKLIKERRYLIYKTLGGNLGIQPSFPLDVHTSIRHLQSSSRTWQTTSIQAFVGGCIHGEIRKRRLSYKDRAASACKQ